MPNSKFRTFFKHVQEFALCQSVKSGEPVVFSTCPRTAHDTSIVKRKAIGVHTPSSVAEFVLQPRHINLVSGICGKAVENLGDDFFLCHNSCIFGFPIVYANIVPNLRGILKSRWRVA